MACCVATTSGRTQLSAAGTAEESLSTRTDKDVIHLVSQVRHNGYIAASPDYPAYSPHWIRDASWVAMSLIDYSEFNSRSESKLATLAHDAASRINKFHCLVLDRHLARMERGIDLTLEDKDKQLFNSLQSHVPARVDEFGRFYYGKFRSAAGTQFIIDDKQQLYSDSCLRQYDTVPLVLMALEREVRAFGADSLGLEQREFLRESGELLAKYIGKIYMTPSANSWEEDINRIHAYDIAAVHSGFSSLKYLSGEGIVPLSESDLDRISEFYHGKDSRGPRGFLRKHVVGGILTRRREPFVEGVQEGVDSEEMFIFTRFGIGDKELGEGVVRTTMHRIDSDLFDGNAAPIRYIGDEYFMGGRWLNLLFERAIYAIRNGDLDLAAQKIGYVAAKYGDSLPEQEIVNPASPGSLRGMRDLEENNGLPVQRLAWSYAARISAIIEFHRHMDESADEPLSSVARR